MELKQTINYMTIKLEGLIREQTIIESVIDYLKKLDSQKDENESKEIL